MPKISKEKNKGTDKEKVTKISKITKSLSEKTKTNKKTEKNEKKSTKKATSRTSKKTSTQKNIKDTKDTKTLTKKTSKNVATTTKKVSTYTEYYDLPFRYNKTLVTILAQTPNMLFIYWDISDEDRNAYIQKYGQNFFNDTRPYLIITNTTMNYSFEVEINDFANSWYLHINDANCKYTIELVRKFITNSVETPNENSTDTNKFEPYYTNQYVSITFSNQLETPNNHIKIFILYHFYKTLAKYTKFLTFIKKYIIQILYLMKLSLIYHHHLEKE